MTDVIEWLIKFVGGLCLGAVLLWFGLKLIEWSMRSAKGYRYFCEYIWHRQKFQKWAKENCQYAGEEPNDR